MGRASEEYKRLFDYVKDKNDNNPDTDKPVTFDYVTVERETGISMAKATGNRTKLAKAIIRNGRRAVTYPGLGYEIDHGENTMQIADKSRRKVVNTIIREGTTTRIVAKRHFKHLTRDQQGRLRTLVQGYSILDRSATTFRKVEIETIGELPPSDPGARK